MKLEFISQQRGTRKTRDLLDKARFDFNMNRNVFIIGHNINSTKNLIYNLNKLDVQAKELDRELNCLRGLIEPISIFIDESYMMDFEKFEELLKRIEEYSFIGSHDVYVYCTGTPNVSICDYLFNNPKELEHKRNLDLRKKRKCA
jgi:hypothetical protein